MVRLPRWRKFDIKRGIDDHGAPGLVDRVFVVLAGSRWFDSHGGASPNDFSDPIDQDIRTQ